MGKNKNRHNNEVVAEVEAAEIEEVKELPAEQDDSTEEIQKKEEKEMKPKRRNVLQFIGDGIKAAGDKMASFGEKHPVIATTTKVAAATVALGGVALGVVTAIKNGNEEDAIDVEAEETDLDQDFTDEEIEQFYDEENSTSSDSDETETTATEE